MIFLKPSGKSLKLVIHSHHVLPRVELYTGRGGIVRRGPLWRGGGSGLAAFGQWVGARNLLDDFTENIADTEKDKGGGYGIVLNQLD
jgi:hypothetical protein